MNEKKGHNAPGQQQCKVSNSLPNLQLTDEANDFFDSAAQAVREASEIKPINQNAVEVVQKVLHDNPLDGESLKTAQAIAPMFDFSLTSNIDGGQAANTDELPIWGISETMQQIVTEVSTARQLPRDYALASMFAATSCLLGKSIYSDFDGYKNYGGLWLCLIGAPSMCKTPAISFFFKPINKMEKEAHTKYLREKAEWIKSSNDKKNGDTATPPPIYRHRIIDDASDESVINELANNSSLTWKCDELKGVFGSWGRYAKNGSTMIEQQMQRVFSNDDVQTTRKGQDPLYLEEPNLTIFGGIQPMTLQRLMHGKGWTDDGLFQRFLFVYPEDRTLDICNDRRIDDSVVKAWNEFVQDISHISPFTMIETNEAYQMHRNQALHWKILSKGRYRDDPAMSAQVLKMGYYICRWSIVAAVLAGKSTIDADVMRYTIECCDWFIRSNEKTLRLIEGNSGTKMPTKKEVIQLVKYYWAKDFNISKQAEAIGITRQAVQDLLKP